LQACAENPGGMAWEPISPELALVDPSLAAAARAALPDPAPAPRRAHTPAGPPSAPAPPRRHGYPFWARLTAALWLLVLGILIGGAAIPHAQDKPRVVPPSEDVTVCRPAPEKPR
jgi:hypothetical protein